MKRTMPCGAAPRAGHPAAPLSPVADNRKHGTTAWEITNQGSSDAIEGYADHVSVLPGDPHLLEGPGQ